MTVIEPVVSEYGLELVDAELLQGPGAALLRVTLDTPRGDGQVSIESCAEISRELGVHLDAANLIAGRYRLEVSSPGLDRVLAREVDFERAVGREIQLETRAPIAGRRRFRGELLAFAEGTLTLRSEGHECAIPFEAVNRARVVYHVTRADFAREARH